MKLNDLFTKYPARALQACDGDPAFRRLVWAPFLENLHESKVIYRERFVCLARIDDLQITDLGIKGIIVPLNYIHLPTRFHLSFKTWHFGGTWAHMTQGNGYLSQPYAGWAIWPEAERVRAIETLLSRDDAEGALELIN